MVYSEPYDSLMGGGGGRVLSHCNIRADFIILWEYFNHRFWTIVEEKYPRFNWT